MAQGKASSSSRRRNGFSNFTPSPAIRQLVKSGLNRLRSERAGYDPKDADADFQAVMSTKAEKFNASMLKVQDSFQTAMLPALEKFVAVLPELTRVVEQGVKFFGDNPWKGLGAIVGASIAKDVATPGVQKLVTSAFTNMGANLGTLSVVAGVAYMTYNKLNDEMNADAEEFAEGGNMGAKALSVEDKLAAAKTPEELRAAMVTATGMKRDTTEAKGNLGKMNTTDSVGAAATTALGWVPGLGDELKGASASRDAQKKKQEASLTDSLSHLDKAMAEAAKRMQAHAASMPTGAGAGAPERNAPMSSGSRGGTSH